MTIATLICGGLCVSTLASLFIGRALKVLNSESDPSPLDQKRQAWGNGHRTEPTIHAKLIEVPRPSAEDVKAFASGSSGTVGTRTRWNGTEDEWT
jgi:hypothetical protein